MVGHGRKRRTLVAVMFRGGPKILLESLPRRIPDRPRPIITTLTPIQVVGMDDAPTIG